MSIDAFYRLYIKVLMLLFMLNTKIILHRKEVDLIDEKKERIRARVFNIAQYQYNPKTGEYLHFDENKIKEALEHPCIKRYAWIEHNKDIYTEKEESQGKGKAGKRKGKHWHVVLDCPNKGYLDTIAEWFNVPLNAIDLPKGHGAFLDCVQYLTHESEKCQKEGKTLYEDSEVIANFDWRKELNEREENRLKYGGDLSKKDRMLFDVLYLGKTLKECREEDKKLYMDNLEKFKKFRLEYISSHMEVPKNRINIYVCGGGGVGKDVASRAIARCLYPCIENDEDLFFELGCDNVSYEGCDAQPVNILSDYRAYTLLDAYKGRENLFKVFDSHPHNSRVNVKFSSIKPVNSVNIVNSVQGYETFLNGLAGHYKDKHGNEHKAEDKAQSYRRFPIIFELEEDTITIYVNQYFINKSADATEYKVWKKVKGNFGKIRKAFCNNEEKARFYENKLLNGFAELVQEIMANEPQQTDEELEEMFKDYGEEITEEESQKVKEEIEKIEIDDCVFYYTKSGLCIDDCIIPENCVEKRSEIFDKFITEKKKREEAKKQKAKEEEKKKNALKGIDLYTFLYGFDEDVEENKTDDLDKDYENNEEDFFG